MSDILSEAAADQIVAVNTPYPTMRVTDLLTRFAPYNPRKLTQTQFEALQRSIDEFGFVEPVVINTRTGRIIGGHQRARAASALGLVEVPVYMVDLDEDQEKALNIALNKVSGEWDVDMLNELIAGLDEHLRALTGFTEEELAKLTADPFDKQKETKPRQATYTIEQLRLLARAVYPTMADDIEEFLNVLEEREKG
jgi:ParB-like chromosome segregation protein Spo0J